MIEQLTQAAIPIICAALLFLVYYGIKFLRERTENENVKAALLVLENAVHAVVYDLRGQADSLRDEAGKLPINAAKEIKQQAMTEINRIVTENIKSALNPRVADFEKFLSGKIESTVGQIKSSQVKTASG